MATPFEEFVNRELPRRSAHLTLAITGYDGDPNGGGAPSIIQSAPLGTWFHEDSEDRWWRRGKAAWVVPGGGMPVNHYIETGALAPGDHVLNDATNWAIIRSVIRAVRVKTDSADWDAWLYVGTFDEDALTTIRLTEDPDNVYSGDQDLTVDRQYNPGDVNVKLRYTDNAGSDTATFRIEGEERA